MKIETSEIEQITTNTSKHVYNIHVKTIYEKHLSLLNWIRYLFYVIVFGLDTKLVFPVKHALHACVSARARLRESHSRFCTQHPDEHAADRAYTYTHTRTCVFSRGGCAMCWLCAHVDEFIRMLARCACTCKRPVYDKVHAHNMRSTLQPHRYFPYNSNRVARQTLPD